MPNYDYRCEVCGGVQEIYKQFGDDSIPVCCQQSMSIIFQATPAVFKGGGWGGM